MPSKIEGFGLTGLDAVAAGIPLLASTESGLGEVLVRVATTLHGNLKQIALDSVLEVKPEGDGIVNTWTDAVVNRLSDCGKAFSDASDLRDALSSTFDWMRAAETLTRAALRAMEH
jgi:glycosyltransferase involved in cell wall biosynthesis